MQTLFDLPPAIEKIKVNYNFQNVADIKELLSYIKKDDFTFEQFRELRDYMIGHETQLAAVFDKMTIAAINTFIVTRPGTKKARLVNDCVESILHSFQIGDGMISYSPFEGETYKSALLKTFENHTPELYESWKDARRKKAAAFKKAMENPETLEEFNQFVYRKGEKALSTEQREIYDELRTGITKEQKARDAERKAQITAVSMENTEMIIIPTVHTIKNIPLWVVRLSERVERHIYKDLEDRARKLGGYYSSYTKNGAIAGFTFTRQEAAELFIQIKDGDVNATDLRKAINADKQQQRAENLQAKAEDINERATEELNRDRKDNTARRARMASSAEQAAAAEILFAQTMEKIAAGMAAGTVTHLNRLSTIAQLDELNSVLRQAKWKYIQEKNMRENDFQFTPEVIDFVQFPYPVVYKEYILPTVMKLVNDNGKKLAAARLVKALVNMKTETGIIKEGRLMEDFKSCLLWTSPGIDAYQVKRYKEQYLSYERITRLGITTPHELRSALRELVRIKEGIRLSPEQKKAQAIRELERKFVGKKIDGFFPTPADLGAETVRKAGIEKGDRVLEPSAGLGHLAEAILEAHPDVDLTCIEMHQPLAEALKLKGFDTVNADFLTTMETADKWIMNPPFENGQDIDHVLHAWNLTNPRGRVVAIMAGNKFDRANESESLKKLLGLIASYGDYEENPSGSFISAFRPTGVNTITVVLDKPE